MRLREIQKLLAENIGKMTLAGSQVGPTNPVQYQFLNVLSTNEAVDAFEKLGTLFQTDINELKLTSFYKNPYDAINVSQQEYSKINGAFNRLKQSVNRLNDVISKALENKELNEKMVSIKIKELGDISDLIGLLEKLRKVIQLPISEYSQGGEIQILDFDSGSFWIDIMLPTSSAVILLGSIAWAGAVIFKKYQESFAFKNYADGLRIQKEHLEILKEAAKAKIELDIEAEAKMIQNEYFTPEDAEQLNRLKLSIKEYSKLIEKGVEIQPSLAAPENIANLFPNFKVLNLIESKIKHLEDKK